MEESTAERQYSIYYEMSRMIFENFQPLHLPCNQRSDHAICDLSRRAREKGGSFSTPISVAAIYHFLCLRIPIPCRPFVRSSTISLPGHVPRYIYTNGGGGKALVARAARVSIWNFQPSSTTSERERGMDGVRSAGGRRSLAAGLLY